MIATIADTPSNTLQMEVVEEIRKQANQQLDPKRKIALGQFMTPFKIGEFMAGLFTNRLNAYLLDAGAGIGSLTLAVSQVLTIKHADLWEIDPVMIRYLRENLETAQIPGIIHEKDFIIDSVEGILGGKAGLFTHAILNPPYKKINIDSIHRLACSRVGIETVNMYTAFLALTIMQMQDQGEIVAIIPRSFCNGPYYKTFRAMLLAQCSIDVIHIFESRNKAFRDDEVLQENIIIKLTRGKKQGKVKLSFSHDATFNDLHQKEVDFSSILQTGDRELFIRIPNGDEALRDDLFEFSLRDLGLEVCTGPAVDFRLKEWWRDEPTDETVPCIYPHHFTKEGFQWPRKHKKPNALSRSSEVEKWLMPQGVYVLVKRFSSKEERRRVVAYLLTPEDLPGNVVAFENHWNVFHIKKGGLPIEIARGLTCFLNSTILDSYFRVFSGHTQVNATDLRNMRYPSLQLLKRAGNRYKSDMSQEEIDLLFEIA